MGLLVLPTIASIAEDAMSAVPQSLREGAFGLGANRMQVSLRIVFPAALSGIVAALVLGASRAVGETVLVLVAGGQSPNLGVDPRESYQTMAAFIASIARGDIPTGSIEYKTIFAVGFTLFVLTLVLNLDLDPARPQVPAGVRMTAAQIAASVIPRAERQGQGRHDALPRADVRRARRSPSSASALIIYDFASDGLPVRLLALRHELPLAGDPGARRHRVGDRRDDLPDGHLRGARGPDRRHDRDLPRGVRGPPTAGGTA